MRNRYSRKLSEEDKKIILSLIDRLNIK